MNEMIRAKEEELEADKQTLANRFAFLNHTMPRVVEAGKRGDQTSRNKGAANAVTIFTTKNFAGFDIILEVPEGGKAVSLIELWFYPKGRARKDSPDLKLTYNQPNFEAKNCTILNFNSDLDWQLALLEVLPNAPQILKDREDREKEATQLQSRIEALDNEISKVREQHNRFHIVPTKDPDREKELNELVAKQMKEAEEKLIKPAATPVITSSRITEENKNRALAAASK